MEQWLWYLIWMKWVHILSPICSLYHLGILMNYRDSTMIDVRKFERIVCITHPCKCSFVSVEGSVFSLNIMNSSPLCYNSFYEAVTHRELIQSYGHLKLNRLQTHWLSFVTHSYLTFGLVFPEYDDWLSLKMWSHDIVAFFTKKQTIIAIVLIM